MSNPLSNSKKSTQSGTSEHDVSVLPGNSGQPSVRADPGQGEVEMSEEEDLHNSQHEESNHQAQYLDIGDMGGHASDPPSTPKASSQLLQSGRYTRLWDALKQYSNLPPILQSLVEHPTIAISRYSREFDDKSRLAKGGYGSVYKARNKVDQQVYAIKKVLLDPKQFNQIKAQGEIALDKWLKELHVLARLHHPNVVRYFAGWIDLADELDDPMDEPSSSETHKTYPKPSRGIFDKTECKEGLSSPKKPFLTPLRQPRSPATGVEVNNPQPKIKASGHKEISVKAKGGDSPILVMTIQMYLYPFNLAEFIQSPLTTVRPQVTQLPATHCHHLKPSLEIFLKILNGVEYIHQVGFIHQDLKPSNILMDFCFGETPGPGVNNGWVKVSDCAECAQKGQVRELWVNPRIADLGLVADIDEEGRKREKVVGTMMYQPPAYNTMTPFRDIYALGLVLLELSLPFKTAIHRIHTMKRVRGGGYLYIENGKGWQETSALIISMTARDEQDRPSTGEIRTILERVLKY